MTPLIAMRDMSLLHFIHSLWSDVAFLTLQTDANEKRYPKRNLRYVIRLHIYNEDILGVINHYSLLTPGPSSTSDSSTEAGVALIGTGDGSALAWMILGHNIFGINVIRATTVWRDANGDINMLQQLEPSLDPTVPVIDPLSDPETGDPPAPGTGNAIREGEIFLAVARGSDG